MKLTRHGDRLSGFTLIEMLLVIVIIAVLAALLLPAVNKAIQASERQKAQTTAYQLATAFRNYQTEYGTWPDSSSNGLGVSATMVTALTKLDSTLNPRGIVFLEVDQKSVKTGSYCDPWGGVFQVQFDQTYKGSVTAPDGKTVPAGVVVWSYGPTGAANSNGWVKSW
jgi:prepilin-type N-terminal cleavage/methylation domain-containing protein